ncbi:hypothetical protein DD924_13565, partial [Staphylococcus pseudintermedius]
IKRINLSIFILAFIYEMQQVYSFYERKCFNLKYFPTIEAIETGSLSTSVGETITALRHYGFLISASIYRLISINND